MKKYEARFLIKKSLYYRLFKSLNKSLQEDILERINVLIREEKAYCDRGNYQHLSDIFAAIALYQGLQSRGMTEERAFQTIWDALTLAVQRRRKIMQALAGKPGFWTIMKTIVPIGFHYGSGKGWRFRWFTTQFKNQYYFEVRECIYQKIFKKRNLEKLGPMFCRCDLIMYGQLSGIDFQRKGTLCYGEKKCDFKFIRHKKGKQFQRSHSR
ncbi:hypothetical protein EII17_14260 [Clostridiales bacterium COT073_COT-073]|nr:hypothetical protein EII17_14260 [Clostridiales bacterium COT073_COT-073]